MSDVEEEYEWVSNHLKDWRVISWKLTLLEYLTLTSLFCVLSILGSRQRVCHLCSDSDKGVGLVIGSLALECGSDRSLRSVIGPMPRGSWLDNSLHCFCLPWGTVEICHLVIITHWAHHCAFRGNKWFLHCFLPHLYFSLSLSLSLSLLFYVSFCTPFSSASASLAFFWPHKWTSGCSTCDMWVVHTDSLHTQSQP